MESTLSYLLLAIICSYITTTTPAKLQVEKRVLPVNEECNPTSGTCVKGDLIKTSVADCEFQKSSWYMYSCTASNNVWTHWVVEPEKNGNCLPMNGKKIKCGAIGSKTRCVCNSPILGRNTCRCQYWTQETPGASQNAFCTAYYIDAGTSGLHHYTCCNNCNDPSTSCDGRTYHGGSSMSYCGTCGKPTGGGRVEYYFNCKDCQTQSKCADMCDNNFPGATLPGLCWKWVDCFAGCCREMATQFSRRRQADTPIEFCGDGTCQQSSEDPDTCPSDCCYLRNSTCTSGCSLECCRTATCCSPAPLIDSSASFGGVFFLLVLSLASMHLFIN